MLAGSLARRLGLVAGAGAAACWRRPAVVAAAQAVRCIATADEQLQRRLETRIHRLKNDGNNNVGYPGRRLTKWEPIGEEQRLIIRSLKRNMSDFDWEGALTVLQTIPQNPGVEWNPVFRAVLQCCCRAVKPEAAQTVFGRMPYRDIKAYNMLLHMYCHLQQIQEMNRLRAQMDAEGIKPSAVTHLAMFKVWSLLGMWEEADQGLRVLKADASLHEEVNWEVVYLSAINACARAGQQQEKAREIFDEFAARPGTQVIHSHYNALLGAYKHSPQESRQVFDEMRRAGLAPRVRDWCKLMVCYRYSWPEMVEVYEEMKREALVADDDTFAQLLIAARHLRNLDGIRWAKQEMAAAGVDPQRQGALPQLRGSFLAAEDVLQYDSGLATGTSPSSSSFPSPSSPLASSSAASSEPSPSLSGPAPLAAAAPAAVAALPEGWAEAVDPTSGRSYYWSLADPATTTTWQRPVAGSL